jgi:hypothetical protein
VGRTFPGLLDPVEDFYESRYVKIGQSMRDIDLIAAAMISNFSRIPTFEAVETPIRDFANAAKVKTETLRTDPGIFDVWSHLVTAGERLAHFTPQAAAEAAKSARQPAAQPFGWLAAAAQRPRPGVLYRARTHANAKSTQRIHRALRGLPEQRPRVLHAGAAARLRRTCIPTRLPKQRFVRCSGRENLA